MSQRAKLLRTVWWPALLAHSLASAGNPVSPDYTINECQSIAPQRRTLCVSARFTNTTGTAMLSCAALKHNPKRLKAPSWRQLTGYPHVTCQKSESCRFIIQNDAIYPETSYDVFCIDWYSNGPPFDIVPACGTTTTKACGLVLTTASGSGGRMHEVFGLEDFFCVLLLLAYVGWSYVFQVCQVLHETGAAVVVGLIAGYIMKSFSGRPASFSYDMFSYMLLPMVIFAAGFNLDKQKFFRFGGYICALGITGTVCIFLLIYFGSEIFTIHPATGDPFVIPPQNRLILASVLASTDTVAPMAFISASDFPQLYAVIFGEGVLNDVVSILLSTSVEDATSLPPLLELFGRLLKVFACSSALGIAFGLATSLLFKHGKVLQKEVMRPVVLLFGCNYACYILTEICELSSIFALFVCSVLSGHYAQHGLSREAQMFTSELAELMAYMAESVVFGYFGLTAVAYTSEGADVGFQFHLIFYYIICIVGARTISILVLAVAMRLIKGGRPLSLNAKELCMVGMAGCMRGTIAYALILRAVPPEDEQSHVDRLMVTTVLGIVLVNCLVFGTLFPVVMRLLRLQPRPAGLVDSTPRTFSVGTTVRRSLGRWWSNLDEKFLAPVFRPEPQPNDDEDRSQTLSLPVCPS